jgi:hypothetical protein
MVDGLKMTEVRGQKAEDIGQRTEGRGQKTDDGRQMAVAHEFRSWNVEFGKEKRWTN